MKKTYHRATITLLTLVLANTFALGAAFASHVGTWNFTGLDGKITSAATGTATRVQGSVTISSNGALTFSWDATANQTNPFTADSNIPDRVRNNTTALIATGTSATAGTIVKLLKIDNDIWTLQLHRRVANPGGGTTTGDRIIAGILHRDSLPAPMASAWTKEFDCNWSSIHTGEYLEASDIYSSSEYEGSVLQTAAIGSGITGLPRAIIYNAHDSESGYVATIARDTKGQYTTTVDGAIILRTWWEGGAYYTMEDEDRDELTSKLANGVWYHLDSNKSWVRDYDARILSPDGNFRTKDSPRDDDVLLGKEICFQLSGNRIASVFMEGYIDGLACSTMVESPVFGGGSIGAGANEGNNNGTSSGGESGGSGGGATSLWWLAAVSGLLALRLKRCRAP